MKLTYLLILALSVLPPVATAGAGGTISGKIIVRNGSTRRTSGMTVDYLWVYLEPKDPPAAKPGKQATARIAQRCRQFEPHVVVIPQGGTVSFPNYDVDEHSVFSPPTAPTDPGWDFGRYPYKVPGKSRSFLEAKTYTIYCDIHMAMWAYVKAVPSAYFAHVEKEAYELTGIAPGTYRVVAWAPESPEVSSEWITISGNDVHRLPDLKIKEGTLPAYHPQLNGQPYPKYVAKPASPCPEGSASPGSDPAR